MRLYRLLAFLPLAAALHRTRYKAGDHTWNVPIVPGGPTVRINGTVEHVYAELSKINPSFESDFPPQILSIGQPQSSMQKRGYSMTRISCRKDFYQVDLPHTVLKDDIRHGREGVAYLRGVPGTPTLPAGPGRCERVSCSWELGIWWCNDSRQEKKLDSYDAIGTAAQTIIDHCTSEEKTAMGQVEFADGWTVIYRAGHEC